MKERSIARAVLPGLLVVVLLAAAPALADEANEGRNWSDKAEFGLVTTTGNSETTTFSLANEFVQKWSVSELKITALALRSEQTTKTVVNQMGHLVVTDNTETTAETYRLDGKFLREIREHFGWYAEAGWDKDEPQGIDSRWYVGTGVAFAVLRRGEHSLDAEVGARLTDETPVGGDSDSYGVGRAALAWDWKFSETGELSSDLELLQNLSTSDDTRINWITSVTSTLSDRLALKVSYTVRWDNDPVRETLSAAGFPDVVYEHDSTDTILAASLVVNF